MVRPDFATTATGVLVHDNVGACLIFYTVDRSILGIRRREDRQEQQHEQAVFWHDSHNYPLKFRFQDRNCNHGGHDYQPYLPGSEPVNRKAALATTTSTIAVVRFS
jgi:hypothetical protein